METETGTTLKSRLADLERVAADFEKKLQLDKIKIQEVNLEVNRETLLKMDPVDINIMCMEWAAYSLGVQQQLNIATSRFHWAESILSQYMGEHSQDYKGFSYSERCAYCLASDSYAQSVEEFKRKCKLIVDRNMFLTSKIDFLCKMAQNVAYAKRGERNAD